MRAEGGSETSRHNASACQVTQAEPHVWVSDAWHVSYGRWDFDPRVECIDSHNNGAPPGDWHRGGGYVGWSPLAPRHALRFGLLEETPVLFPASLRVVEERRFLEPIRPTTVGEHTTIITIPLNHER